MGNSQNIGFVKKDSNFHNKVLIVNGWEGCGKTCISSLFKAIDGIEVMRYSSEFEWICCLWLANQLNTRSAKTILSSISDLLIYNHYQSREVNFRPSDLSSIFRTPFWYKYFFRLFSEGGENCEKYITNKSILNLVTHDLFNCSSLLESTFGERLIHIEVIRDPIYMLKQVYYNQESLYKTNSPRHFTLLYEHNGLAVYDGYEAKNDLELDSWELAFRLLQRRIKFYMESNLQLSSAKGLYPIFFEDFVKEPYKDLDTIESRYGVRFNKSIRKYLKSEKIPRTHHSESKDLPIYRKIGWVNLKKSYMNISDSESYINHYRDIGVPHKTIMNLVDLSQDYQLWKRSLGS